MKKKRKGLKRSSYNRLKVKGGAKEMR